MEKRMLFEATPVAAIHCRVIAHIERAGDDFAVALGQHQTKIRSESLIKLVEQFLGQVLTAVIEPIDMAFVQAKHRAQVTLRQFIAFVSTDGNAALHHFAPLALDLVTPVTAEAGKVIVKRIEATILPMVLNSVARKKAYRLERCPLVSEAEVYMHGRDLVIRGDLRQCLAHEAHHLAAIFAIGGQKAVTGDRSKGNADEHLWIILNSRPMRRFGPFIIEDELAHAVEL